MPSTHVGEVGTYLFISLIAIGAYAAQLFFGTSIQLCMSMLYYMHYVRRYVHGFVGSYYSLVLFSLPWTLLFPAVYVLFCFFPLYVHFILLLVPFSMIRGTSALER